jgi:hypothetical protein
MTPTWAEIGGVVLFLVTIGGTLAGIYWRWSGMVGSVDKDLQKHKLHVAETYATKQSMNDGFASVNKTMNDIGERIDKRLDGMSGRLDRVIEGQHGDNRA